VKELLKRVVTGSSVEAPLKRVHAMVSGNRNSAYDWHTIEIMRRVLRPDSGAIDVGAFDGGMLRHMERFSPNGRLFAFEPIPERFERLKRRFPKAQIYPYALGAASGEATFYQFLEHPPLSGLRRREDVLPHASVREVRVTVETLDRVIPEDARVAFVKIDVEGGELGVFQGGTETLRRHSPVLVFECGIGGADQFGVKPEDVFDAVRECGLAISVLPGWLAHAPALGRTEFAEQFWNHGDFYFVAHPVKGTT
jgi:FkbM family methyltransferase